MKFKTKYKYRDRELHFESLRRLIELKKSLERAVYTTPLLDFLCKSRERYTRGYYWHSEDISVIGQDGCTPT